MSAEALVWPPMPESLQRRLTMSSVKMIEKGHIRLHKAILWQQAKGALRAFLACEDVRHAVTGEESNGQELDELIDEFITKVEGRDLHDV